MKEEILGHTQTVDYFEDHIIIGLDKKLLKLNDGKQIDFQIKMTEQGKLVLESQCLTKLSKTGASSIVKH